MPTITRLVLALCLAPAVPLTAVAHTEEPIRETCALRLEFGQSTSPPGAGPLYCVVVVTDEAKRLPGFDVWDLWMGTTDPKEGRPGVYWQVEKRVGADWQRLPVERSGTARACGKDRLRWDLRKLVPDLAAPGIYRVRMFSQAIIIQRTLESRGQATTYRDRLAAPWVVFTVAKESPEAYEALRTRLRDAATPDELIQTLATTVTSSPRDQWLAVRDQVTEMFTHDDAGVRAAAANVWLERLDWDHDSPPRQEFVQAVTILRSASPAAARQRLLLTQTRNAVFHYVRSRDDYRALGEYLGTWVLAEKDGDARVALLRLSVPPHVAEQLAWKDPLPEVRLAALQRYVDSVREPSFSRRQEKGTTDFLVG